MWCFLVSFLSYFFFIFKMVFCSALGLVGGFGFALVRLYFLLRFGVMLLVSCCSGFDLELHFLICCCMSGFADLSGLEAVFLVSPLCFLRLCF